MSQFPPNPPYYQGYGGVPNHYNGPIPNRRPGAITGVAIAGIILGILGLLCSVPSIFLNLSALTNGGRNPLMPSLPPMSHNLAAFSVFQCTFNTIISLTLLICCSGAMGLKPWARSVLMPWSVVAIIWAIVLAVVQLMWMNPEISKMTQSIHGGNAAFNSGFNSGQEIGRNIGVVLMMAAMCVIPILILTLWNRPHVKAAFGLDAGTTPFPPQSPPMYPPNYQ